MTEKKETKTKRIKSVTDKDNKPKEQGSTTDELKSTEPKTVRKRRVPPINKPPTRPASVKSERTEPKQLDPNNLPEILPLIPLKATVAFPHAIIPIRIGRAISLRALESAQKTQPLVGLITQRDESVEEVKPDDCFQVGTISLVLRIADLPETGKQTLMQGMARFKILDIVQTEPYIAARIKVIAEEYIDDVDVQALMRAVLDQFKEYINLNKTIPTEVLMSASNLKNASMLADFIAVNSILKMEERQKILETFDVKERLHAIAEMLIRETQLLNMSNKIQNQVQEEVGKNQRDYFLREQMKVLRRELGEEDDKALEQKQYQEKIEAAKMPDDVEKKAKDELKRLERMHPESAESAVVRNYLDTMLALPWAISSTDRYDIPTAERILEEDHFGLEKVKMRLLEYLGVLKLKQTIKGPILCLIGPPGVGKTSLGRSVARALDRKFIRMSLGGIRDEAEIRGHRRTYVGAMPGRIIQGLRTAGTRNPVFMLDEIDKVGADFRGDPSSALLEALDPEQNYAFSDHYLEVPFDLSSVLFIATANVADTIPPPLLDRMEVITLAGYTELEKIQIAKYYLIPRQLENHGLTEKNLKFDTEALKEIVLKYTREAGMRNFEREIAKISRKVALRIARDEISSFTFKKSDLPEFLGVERFDLLSERYGDQVGAATGLAWTSTGGDTLIIETEKMVGKGGLLITGHLGEVMQESCKIALSWARAQAEQCGFNVDDFAKFDIHIHVPAGAIPKDGPSAGITIATAMVSLLTNVPINSKIAMTGELSLLGHVLPIGGLKEKMLAAKRAGITRIIMPERNRKDLPDVPAEVRRGMRVAFVNKLEEVLPLVLKNKIGTIKPLPFDSHSELLTKEADEQLNKVKSAQKGIKRKPLDQTGGKA